MTKKGNPDFTPMSQEQREQSKLQRIAAQEFAKEHLYTEYKDEGFWRENASKVGLRLPGWWIPSSETKYVRRACKKLGVDVNSFVESTGFSNLNHFVKANPKWSAVGIVGLCIEFAIETGKLV